MGYLSMDPGAGFTSPQGQEWARRNPDGSAMDPNLQPAPSDPREGNRGSGAPINQPMQGAGQSPAGDPYAQQWVNPEADRGGWTVQNAPGQMDQPLQTAPTTLNGQLNEAQFRTWLNQQYIKAGHPPPDQEGFNTWYGYYNQFGKNDPAYLTQRLQQGLDGTTPPDNGGGAGGGNLASLGAGGMSHVSPFKGLSYEDFLKSPGYQASFKEAQRGLQTSAAAKGTLLNARTNEAMGKSLADFAETAYGQEFNRALQTHQSAFNDDYNLANLGMNATNSSFA